MEIGDIIMDVRKRTACKLILDMCRTTESPKDLFWNERVALSKMITGLNVKITNQTKGNYR